jgi:hypothetical protein
MAVFEPKVLRKGEWEMIVQLFVMHVAWAEPLGGLCM